MTRLRAAGMALVLALTMVVLAGGAALAKGGGDTEEMSLLSTAAGRSINASGSALIEQRDDGQENFKVAMRARGVNGKTFKVMVTNSAFPGQTFRAGSFVVTLGSGELEIDNDDGARLPRGLQPVLGVQRVIVKDSTGKVVLRGVFKQ